MSNSKNIDKELQNEAEWWKSDGESGSLPSPKDYDNATVHGSSKYVATIPNPDYISQKDMGSPDSLKREAKEAKVVKAKEAKVVKEKEEAELVKEKEEPEKIVSPILSWKEKLAIRQRNNDKGTKMSGEVKTSLTERAMENLLNFNDLFKLSSTTRGIITVNNGSTIFEGYNIFKDCEDIHFHVWNGGGGIRFRFEDGSEMQYNIGSARRDGFVFTKSKGEGAGDRYYDLILNQRNRQGLKSFTDDVKNADMHDVRYNNTTVGKAIEELEKRDLGNFLEIVERYVQVLTAGERYRSYRRGGRKTRKYKKKNNRKTRRVRKSRKKLKSRKSRKKRKINKLRKSRRRSSIRR